MKRKKNMILILGLILVFTVIVIPISGDDVTKLVRIHKDDNWLYDTAKGIINYTVVDTFINSDNREVNHILYNKSESNALFTQWTDRGFNTYINGTFSVTDEIFNMNCAIYDFEEFYSTRGNYWQGINGRMNVTLTFGSIVEEWTFNDRQYTLWRNDGSTGSQNLAIVTGEPQIEKRSLTLYNNDNEYICIHVSFRVVPSDPYTSIWNKNNITTVDITEEIISVQISVRIMDGANVHIYDGDSIDISGTNTYVYAKEIGLPIETRKNVSPMPLMVMGIGMGSSTNTITERLIDYSIDDSVSLISIIKDTTISNGVYGVSLLLTMVGLVIMTRRNSYERNQRTIRQTTRRTD